MSDRDDKRLLDLLREGLRSDREPPKRRVDEVRTLAEHRRQLGIEGAEAARRSAARSAGTGTSQGIRLGRRQLLFGGAAASAGAAVGIGAFAFLNEGPPTETVAVAAMQDGVQANAKLINHTWGLEYLLDVRGLDPGDSYEVMYRAADGADDLSAGSFVGVADITSCRMTGALLRDQTQAIEVLDADGSVVLRSRLT